VVGESPAIADAPARAEHRTTKFRYARAASIASSQKESSNYP
jgi:hypothetical protein